MCSLSPVQHRGMAPRRLSAGPMRTLLFVVAAVLAIVPGWSGPQRLPLLGRDAIVTADRVPLDPGDPARRQVG